MKPGTTRLLLRWGTWMAYTEWRPDQPHEDWSGRLDARGGVLRNPRQIIYHGVWGAQWRTAVDLPEPRWTSPRLDLERPFYGYKGMDALAVDVEGDARTVLRFSTPMLEAEFRLGDIPAGGRLAFPAGPKYSTSQLVVCRFADEGVYWNARRAAAAARADGRARAVIGPDRFRGSFAPREIHHAVGAWIPPGGAVDVPFRWRAAGTAVVTWRFTGTTWTPSSWGGDGFFCRNSVRVRFETALDGRPLSAPSYRVKYMRGVQSAVEHVDEARGVGDGKAHTLSIANRSADRVYLVLNGVTVEEAPPRWRTIRTHLPFKAGWFDGSLPDLRRVRRDLPTRGRGLLLGYDTNVLAAENGWIDACIRYMAATGGGNYLLFRTESDEVSAEDWRRWFRLCRKHDISFAINTAIDRPALPVPELLREAIRIGGRLFVGMKHHELSGRLYGWPELPPVARTAAGAEKAYLDYVRNSYGRRRVPGVRKLLGEAMLAHRYAYKAGVDVVLSETMTGHTSLLLAEARGAARAYGRDFWGMHVACHVHCSPEDRRHERMFLLNLQLGYLSGAGLIEDEEGGLAKVHSFVSGPSDPLPAARQAAVAGFLRWAAEHPRTAPLKVDTGFLYGNHEAITGGLSLNRTRPVRVWETFGPAGPAWEYGRPERGWLLLDLFMPGVWLCPVLRDPAALRRWFSGTPLGQTDIVPVEADTGVLGSYKLLVFPGWNTMTPAVMDALTAYASGGGTLVLGLPQMQTSDDRDGAALGRGFRFPAAARVERLCGFRLAGGASAAAETRVGGRRFALGRSPDGPLRLAGVEPAGARPVLTAGRRPLLLEHRVGAGRVFTWTALDYAGHRGLLPAARAWLEEFMGSFPLDVRLEGGDGEVAYFVYPEGDRRRVYLVNTDWTEAGNVKRCRVSAGGRSRTVAVREGEIADILL